MPENKPIIIKKVKGKGHAAAHGGTWKVAYADFVTAMMAFFLLMWLLSMVVPEKRARVSEYFKEFSLFEFAKGVPIEQGGAMVVIPGQPGPPIPQNPEMKLRPPRTQLEQIIPQEEVNALRTMIEEKLKDIKEQAFVDTFENGVRIELVYKEGNLYEAGGTKLTESGRRALKIVADSIRNLSNKIAIEGHTDAVAPAAGQGSNWELSTARASAARNVLGQFGVGEDRLLRVAGYAAVQPLITDNPKDPRNRRISILLFNEPKKPGEDLGPKVPLQTAVDQELNATIGRIGDKDVVAIKPPPPPH